MDVHADLEAAVRPEAIFAWVEDLANYPPWLEIVTQAEAVEPDDSGRPAWAVDLRGRLGPMARSKRLRMVRTEHRPSESVTFERAELDGRDHSPWVLSVAVEDAGDSSRLAMNLHYGGGLFAPVIQRVLGDEIERSRDRLRELVESSTRPPSASPSKPS